MTHTSDSESTEDYSMLDAEDFEKSFKNKFGIVPEFKEYPNNLVIKHGDYFKIMRFFKK